MSGFEDDPYLAADRRSHWWQAALVTGGILATLLVALLRHGRDRDRVREAEAIREVGRALSGVTPSTPDGWRGPTGEAWSPAGPSRDAPAVELELISVGGRVDITDASVSIAGRTTSCGRCRRGPSAAGRSPSRTTPGCASARRPTA